METYKENEMVSISINRFNELLDIKQHFDEQVKELQNSYDKNLTNKETEFLKILEHDYLACMDEYDFDRLNRQYTRHDCCRIRGQVYIKMSAEAIIAPYIEKIDYLSKVIADTTKHTRGKRWWQFWK